MDIKNREHFRTLDVSDFDRMNLGQALWNTSLLEIPDTQNYRKKIIQYIDNLGENLVTGKGFLFWGVTGSGKTSAAAIVAKAVVSYNHTYTTLVNRSFMVEAPHLVDTLWNGDWDSKKELWSLIHDCDLFIIDDLGKEWASEYSSNFIEQAIRTRLKTGRSLIVITDLAKKPLAERYGSGFLALLINGACKPLSFNKSWYNTGE